MGVESNNCVFRRILPVFGSLGGKGNHSPLRAGSGSIIYHPWQMAGSIKLLIDIMNVPRGRERDVILCSAWLFLSVCVEGACQPEYGSENQTDEGVSALRRQNISRYARVSAAPIVHLIGGDVVVTSY